MLDRRPSDRFESDKRQADASLKAQVDFIMTNLSHLSKVDKQGRMRVAACSFRDMLKRGDELTPGQRNYVESIYEAVWRGASFQGAGVHHDKRKRGLKFG